MKRVFFVLFLLCVFSGLGAAQTADDYKKVEGYAGYSYGEASGGLHGFEVSGVYNVTRYIGLKGDFSGLYDSQRFGFSNTAPAYTASFTASRSIYNVLGGIQLKDNANKGRFKPFVHALIGLGHTRSLSSDFQCSPAANCPTFAAGSASNNGFAAMVGGGLDLRINKKIQIRLFQLDYNSITNGFGTSRIGRIGAGIVF